MLPLTTGRNDDTKLPAAWKDPAETVPATHSLICRGDYSMMKASFVLSSMLAASLLLTGCAEQKTRASSTPATPAASASTTSTTTQGTADRSAAAARSSTATKSTETAESTTNTAPAAAAGTSGSAESLTGCLSKGESEGTYILTDETSSAKTTVTGTADLAKHAGHKVRLSGSRSGDQFTATAVQHIAPSCTTK